MKKRERIAQPETNITLDNLLQGANQSEQAAMQAMLKQQGVKEFLQSLKNEGYEIVPKK